MSRSHIVEAPLLTISALASLAAFAPAALAAQAGAADTTVLAPVVTTATRLPLGQAVPTVSTTVLAGDQLRERHITTVQDALAQVPGVFAARSGSYGGQTSIFVRGGQSDYVQVLIDGVPVNDPGGFIDLANLSTDNVERIEVVRGPASVLYGANAVTGVVQIFTRNGAGPARARLGVSGGTYGAREGDIAVMGGGERASGSLSAAHHGADGIYDFNNGSRNNTFSGALHLAPDARSSIRASLRYIDALAHIPTNSYGVADDSNQFHSERRWIGSLEAGRFVSSRVEARVLLGITDAHVRSADLPDTPDEQCAFCYDARTGTYRGGADARVNFYATPAATLTGGLAYERQRRHSSGSDAAGRTVTAYYAQAVGDILGSRASYAAGLRVDDNTAFGVFTTYRISGGYRLGHGASVHASLGTAFKEPTIDQIASQSPFARGNPELRPERTRSWEAGITQDLLGGVLGLSATYFNQYFRDVIQYDPAPPADGDPNYVNVGAARANGVELEARVRPARAWEVVAGYTRLGTRVTDAGVDAGPGATYVTGARLLRRPSDLANLTIGYRPSERGSLHLGIGYVGDRVDIDFQSFQRVEARSYTRVDLSGELGLFATPGHASPVELTARVENLFDTRYQQIYGYRSPGRALLVGVRLEVGR